MLGYEAYPQVYLCHPCHPRLRMRPMSHFIRSNRVSLTTLQKDSEAMDEDTAKCILAPYRYYFLAHTQRSPLRRLICNSQSIIALHMPASQSEPFQIGYDRAVPAGMTTGRGHHHSLSHNFFSFFDLARQSQPEAKSEELHTVPAPAPMSPWSPVSNVQSGESASSSKVDLTTAPAQHPLHPLN
ncbi:hypothetical protein P692DRAFT_201798534 [Suillus brevipes Sb2]|nr:hypothetical protein P692DRAFT_201798534 [Suillus brevipes Sb2]